MDANSREESPETAALLDRAATGDAEAVAALLDRHRTRLERMVEVRLDRRLRGRVGVSDVLQDVSLEALRRMPRFLETRRMPVFLWLRLLTAQHLAKLVRRHVRTARRSVTREAEGIAHLAASSADCLAAHLVADQTSPSQAAWRAEQRSRLRHALMQLDKNDREVISLRHHEQLSGVEVARELGLETSAASKRYLRAMRRLRRLMGDAVDPGAGDS